MASALKNSLNIPINLSSGQNSVQLLNPGEIADLTDGQVYYIYIVGWPPSSFKVDNYRSYSIDDLSAQFTETPIS